MQIKKGSEIRLSQANQHIEPTLRKETGQFLQHYGLTGSPPPGKEWIPYHDTGHSLEKIINPKSKIVKHGFESNGITFRQEQRAFGINFLDTVRRETGKHASFNEYKKLMQSVATDEFPVLVRKNAKIGQSAFIHPHASEWGAAYQDLVSKGANADVKVHLPSQNTMKVWYAQGVLGLNKMFESNPIQCSHPYPRTPVLQGFKVPTTVKELQDAMALYSKNSSFMKELLNIKLITRMMRLI